MVSAIPLRLGQRVDHHQRLFQLGTDPAAPQGVVAYGLKYEVLANGDKLVMAGYFIPQADGSYVGELQFLPEEGTGRFAGATGLIDVVRAIPGGYVFEGQITTVGATK